MKKQLILTTVITAFTLIPFHAGGAKNIVYIKTNNQALTPISGDSTSNANFEESLGETKIIIAQQIPRNVEEIGNEITVRIEMENNGGGSGVIINKTGSTYTVVTNSHVINQEDKITIYTSDGTAHTGQIVKINNQEKDLALLQFSSDNNYRVAEAIGMNELRSNQPIYATGYTDEQQTSPIINSGELKIINPQAFIEGYQIAYTNHIDKGMSGGAILTAEGKLIGINGIHARPLSWANPYVYLDGSEPSPAEQDIYREYAWGIPITTLEEIAPNYVTISTPKATTSPSISLGGENVAELNLIERVEEKARAITVKIQHVNEPNNWGSGFIAAYEPSSQTYTVITATHVLSQNQAVPFELEVILPDGKKQRIDTDTIRKIKSNDLAIFTFTSETKYQTAIISANTMEEDGGFTFTAGYPLSRKGLAEEYYFSVGTLFKEAEKTDNVQDFQQISQNSYGYSLVYTNWTEKGMSGGPVLDFRGHVVGVHGRIEGEYVREQSSVEDRSVAIPIGYSLGVPTSQLLAYLKNPAAREEGIIPNLDSQESKALENILEIDSDPLPQLTASQTAELRESLEELSPPDNNDANDWAIFANRLWRRGELELALEAYERGIELNPKLYIAWYGKGLTLESQRKYEDAYIAYSEAIKTSEGKYALAYGNRGKVLVWLDRYEEALPDLDKAIELDKNQLKFYFYRGNVYYNLGKYELALKDYDQAITLAPDNAIAYNNRGATYDDLGEDELALKDYDQAITLAPDDALAYFNRGILYYNLGEYELALKDYDQAITLDPDYADAYINRGNTYSTLGEYELALKDYDQAITLDPDNAIAYYNRGNTYYNLGKYELALKDFDQAITLAPDDAKAYNNRGYLYSDLGEYELALKDFDQAITLAPDYASAYFNRGATYGNLGEYELALQDFEQAISLDPDNAYAYNNRGLVYYNLEEYELAIQDFEQALSLDPDNADIDKNLRDAYDKLEKMN